jgi:hypothetical protein
VEDLKSIEVKVYRYNKYTPLLKNSIARMVIEDCRNHPIGRPTAECEAVRWMQGGIWDSVILD